MRGRLLAAATVAALVIVYLVVHGSTPTYKVQAVFDSAEGMVPGQLVKIAGARVGSVTAVKLISTEPAPTARLTLTISRRFAPFHANATCAILPEGLISENYVECDPGAPSQPPLAAAGDGEPTVPLAHTTDPVSLQDVLNIFSLPVSERMGVLINELGVGTAGEGTNINAILQRANPALTQGDRVLSILNAQNQQIATAVGQTGSVLGQLAGERTAVSSFVSRAATVSTTTALHRGQLGQDVQLLPGLLHALRRDLAPINRVAVEGGPLLDSLRAAAPALTELTYALPAFTRPGLPAVEAVANAARTGETTVRTSTPLVDELYRFATTSRPVLPLLAKLLVSSRDSGAFEGLLALVYRLGTDAAEYDSTSHFVSALILAYPECIALPTTPGCNHNYNATDQGSVPIDSARTSVDPGQLKGLLGYLLKR